jgi:mutator protein MutT
METLDVSVVILYDGPCMLVNRRPEGGYFGGWWEWPGGKRLAGESAMECALRELDEEIGITAEGLEEYANEMVDYPGRQLRLTYFVGRRKEGSQARPDALEHRWLMPEAVLALQFLRPNLPVLRRLIETPPFPLNQGRLP